MKKLYQHQVLKCKKSLSKSTYGRRLAFKAGHTYVIASRSTSVVLVTPRPGVVAGKATVQFLWVIDELGNEISFTTSSDPDVTATFLAADNFFENCANLK